MDSSFLRFITMQSSELDRACNIAEMSLVDFGDNMPESNLHWKNFEDLVVRLSVCTKELRSIQSELDDKTSKLINSETGIKFNTRTCFADEPNENVI